MSVFSINVALITAIPLKALEIIFRSGCTQAAFLRHDRRQRQVHIGSQPCRVAADVEVRAFLKPGEQVAGTLIEPVLNVNLSPAVGVPVAREGDIHAGKDSVLDERLPFSLVEEIGAEVALPEEEPRWSGRAACFALL